MTRITRIAGCALALAFLSLSAFTVAHAQTERYNYGFCTGAGKSSGRHVQIVTRAFVVGPAGIPNSGRDGGLGNVVYNTYGPLREDGCIMSLTAAEAEAKQRDVVDQISRNLGPDSVVVVNWIPAGTTALSAAVPEKVPAAAAAKPAAPAPVAAAAPAADTAVKYDRWGKPIPTTAWWVCETHMTKDFYVSAPFFGATNSHADNDIFQSFLDYLNKKYHEAGTATCNKYTTQAEAEQSNAQQAAQAPSTGYQYHKLDWAYAPGAPAATAPAAAPAKPATPAANAAVTPKPAPVAVAAKPASPAPAKPATVAAKPAVYVICKADWNTDLRRFYNPPVDGRGAGYSEWNESWHKYLVARYKFRESNFGCTKYPTREEAQAGFEEWVVTARQTPTMNGLPSPVIITNWKY